MKYYVTHKISARYIIGVDAKDVEEAKTKAAEKFSDADFGEACDIDALLFLQVRKC